MRAAAPTARVRNFVMRLAGRLVLEGGPLPLNVLAQRVDEWVAKEAEQLDRD